MTKPAKTAVHLVVGTPCFGGNVSYLYTNALLALQRACLKDGISLSCLLIAGDSLITRARNLAVQQFLAIPEATHLLFIDADIGFPVQQVFDLLAADKDVCGAIYPAKRFDWKRIRAYAEAHVADLQSSALDYVFELFDASNIEQDGNFLRARYLGTGFMLIKRAVFGRLAEHYPETRYRQTHLGLNVEEDRETASHAYFDCMIDPASGTYLSEDYTFCKRWLDIGGAIWVDARSRLTHIGTHAFEGDLLAMLQAAINARQRLP